MPRADVIADRIGKKKTFKWKNQSRIYIVKARVYYWWTF